MSAISSQIFRIVNDRKKTHKFGNASNAFNSVNLDKCYSSYYSFDSFVCLQFSKNPSRGELTPPQNNLESAL